MKAILSDSTVTEIRACGCEIEFPPAGHDGIVCRIIMPIRSLSAAEWREIFALVIDNLDQQGTIAND